MRDQIKQVIFGSRGRDLGDRLSGGCILDSEVKANAFIGLGLPAEDCVGSEHHQVAAHVLTHTRQRVFGESSRVGEREIAPGVGNVLA